MTSGSEHIQNEIDDGDEKEIKFKMRPTEGDSMEKKRTKT